MYKLRKIFEKMSYAVVSDFKLLVLGLVVLLGSRSHALYFNELYSSHDEESILVQPGDSAFRLVQLEKPINFYSEKYDHININTNGILTFVTEFTEYLNQPFPLEYPSIAPFYANIDTSASNVSTSISFFKSNSPEKIGKALHVVQSAFPEAYDFEPTALYVATWTDVGYFRSKNDLVNTFQVVFLSNEEDTYVQFLYPEGGIKWIKAETGPSGLPDVRAQVGFISEDGRYHTLSQSGTDSVQYLSATSNTGIPGVWVYRVGSLGFTENIEEPTVDKSPVQPPMSCAHGGTRTCHKNARCIDTERGFCCQCHEGFYGNGYNCISNTLPIRVSGSITGVVNNRNISENVKLQSYVVIADGRSYTAVNPVTSNIANELQLALPIGSAIGWIFSKPAAANAKNGYEITGGYLNHTATVTFKGYDHSLTVKQHFGGLNYWDQLTVNIEVYGSLPYVSPESLISVKDFTEEYFYTAPNTLQSYSTPEIFIVNETRKLETYVHQTIEFSPCNGSDAVFDREPVLQKVSKITINYEDKRALRISMLNKMGVDLHSNPCTDGSAICGENTVCTPREDDLYDCICKNGYAPYSDEAEVESCTDIDECRGENICHEFAYCVNIAGGYNCFCHEGYKGNGYQCEKDIPYVPEGHTLSPFYPYDPRNHSSSEYSPHTYKEEEYETTTYPLDTHHGDSTTDHGTFDHHYQTHDDQYNRGNTEYTYEHPSPDPFYPGYGNEYNSGYNGSHYDQTQPSQTDVYEYPTDAPPKKEQPVYPYQNTELPNPYPDCSRCPSEATCLDGVCVCTTGWTGDGVSCSRICRSNERWISGQCVPEYVDESMYEPYCSSEGECACPTNYVYHPEVHQCKLIGHDEYGSAAGQEEAPCADLNCHVNSTCEWSEHDFKYICLCLPGFEGDGYFCNKIEVSCTMKEDICDVNAVCIYIESLGKSECRCSAGYEGDGFTCHPVAECVYNEHCTANSYCDEGICLCFEGYERDSSDFCVPAGLCGGAFCASNAVCKWDTNHVQYCECVEGFQGDGVRSCQPIPVPCNVRNNCGPHASCLPSYRELQTYECVCDSGYYKEGDVCREEKNCRNTPSLCDPNAKCTTTTAGLQCICNPNFYGNGTFCREIVSHEHGFLLISQGVVIIRIPFDGKLGRPVSVAQMAIGLDKDCREGRVYWGDISAKKISSSRYNGTDTQVFMDHDVSSPEGIAVDWISRRLYWTDSTKDTIEVASLDNPQQRAVLVSKNLVNPRGIAVDPHKNKLYWSDWNRDAPKIEMSELDGTNREVLLSKPTVVLPNSLVVLQNTGELCFADAGTHKVECLDTYTRQVRTIATNLSHPFGLTSTDDHFYWTDWTTKQIESVDMYGRRKPGMRTPVFGSHKMYGMTAIVDTCRVGYSACQTDNGGCPEDRLCLVNLNSPSSKSCKCTTNSTSCPSSEYLHQ